MDLSETLRETERRARNLPGEYGTFRDGDGILRCSVCMEPREAFIPEIGKEVPVSCSCYDAAEQARGLQTRVNAAWRKVRSSPLYDAGYERFTFSADDKAQPENSQLCQRFVQRWDEMNNGNYGLIFSGPLGTGKSFLAACIVNALCNQGIPAIIVTTSRLVNVLRASKEPQKVLDDLNTFSLVALDDLGVERDTDFAVEVLENFINSRGLSARPLLVTTNLTGRELSNPYDLRYARIFDRILTLCPIPVVLKGTSRRIGQKDRRRQQMKTLLEEDAVYD